MIVMYFQFINTFTNRKKLQETIVPNGTYAKYIDKIRENKAYFETVEKEEVVIESFDGLKLKAHYVKGANPNKLLIFFHGFKSSYKTDLTNAKAYVDKGYSLLMIEQRSHGGSEGRYITFGVLERHDCASWVKYAVERFSEDVEIILVGVSTSDHDDTEKSLDELEELAQTAGAVTVGRVIQNLDQVHPGTYVGKGKLDEIKELIWETEATGIICDDELSPIQLGNMEDALDTKVMDRTLIILDIFAGRASTNEGKIQVELAQLKYRQSRLTGLGKSLSRLGGGIGTRGPGEKKLEMDRRLIRDRIAQLNRELKDVKRHREITREQRSRNKVPVVAIVGYTNAGKSTLLNALTGAGVLEEDKLFATLDPTTRNLKLPSKQEVLLTDTVGFIRKLPHHLIEAFRSTLEEAKYADIILHVVDASNPQVDEQMHIVYETLTNLEVKNKPIITAFNKQDKIQGESILRDFRADHIVRISAKHGEGLDELQETIEEVLRGQKIYVEKIYSYAEAGKIQLIRKYGELLEEEYRGEGIFAKGYVPVEIYEKVK